MINKTNQFNLTTRRYTSGEVEAIAQDPAFLTLYGRLADKFGDNGLVSVLVGQIADDVLQLDLWLMSCRVLKREMEFAMFDALVEQCQLRGIRKIVGVYHPIEKERYGCRALCQPWFQRDERDIRRLASCGATTFPQLTRREHATFAEPPSRCRWLQFRRAHLYRRRSKCNTCANRVPR